MKSRAWFSMATEDCTRVIFARRKALITRLDTGQSANLSKVSRYATATKILIRCKPRSINWQNLIHQSWSLCLMLFTQMTRSLLSVHLLSKATKIFTVWLNFASPSQSLESHRLHTKFSPSSIIYIAIEWFSSTWTHSMSSSPEGSKLLTLRLLSGLQKLP